MDIKEIYENALTDPTLFSTIDVDALLEKIESQDNNYLENKTLVDISEDLFDAVKILNIPTELANYFCERLIGYRYIERVCDLRSGKLMRWIKQPTNIELNHKSLTNGGILMSIKIENSGVQLLCRNKTNRFFNIKFDDCLLFQKITMEEQLILMAYEYTDKPEV
jgi:hypothetical protein